MKKLIIFAIALLFLCATGIASAADISMSGDYYVQGTYQKNAEGAKTDALQAPSSGDNAESGTMYYDHEFNLNATWSIDDNTSIITQFEMRDEIWGGSNIGESTQLNDADDNTKASEAVLETNIVVEKVYVWHKFANGHETMVGLMSGGTWGTDFQDGAYDAYRVRYDIPTDTVRIVGLVQKVTEAGDADTGMNESEDKDAYVLGFLTKIGDINVKPLFVYKNLANETDVLESNIAFDGKLGTVGFEAEFGVTDTDNVSSEDTRTYGAYANLWHASGPVKAGILGAYGTFDQNTAKTGGAAHSFGGDFDGGGSQIIGVDAGFLDQDNLAAGQLIALYADYDINDKLSLGAYAGYAKCGADIDIDTATGNDTKWDGAKAWELSADAAYKITDNLVYDVGAGVARLKWGTTPANGDDPDKAYRLFHKLTVSF